MSDSGPLAAALPAGDPDGEDCVPVRVDPRAAEPSSLRSLLQARSNLLAIWSEHAYRAQTLSFRLLNQHYFVCNAPDTVRRVFLDRHDNYDRKSPQMRHALEPLLGDGLFVSDGELWRERRRYCAPAFETDLLPQFAALMTESAGELADRWEGLADGGQVDMLNEMARLTARIIGRTVFGDATADSEAAQVVRGFSEYQRNVDQISFADALGLPFLRWLSNPLRRRRANRAITQVHQVIDRIIERQRFRQTGERFTLMSLLLQGDTGRPGAARVCPLGERAARNEAIVMFMAGHETTANSLAWTWYLLDSCPRALARLHGELDRVLGDRPPSYADVPDLPYTRAVLEESLRLYPPVPLLSRQARAEDSVRDKAIHPNSIVLVIPWLLHRHKLFWDKPDSFIPERFLPGVPRPDKFLYLPFSVGHRVCLGLRFGLTEGILCLATLAHRFRVRLAPGHPVEIECRLTLRPKGGLPMILERRRA
jgi:cytochrome P450